MEHVMNANMQCALASVMCIESNASHSLQTVGNYEEPRTEIYVGTIIF